MKAVLVRVGIDQSAESGSWNAPCNPDTCDFVYVPIKQDDANVPGMEKHYTDNVVASLEKFSRENDCDVPLPEHLIGERMHLDPDFKNLTYGDTEKRGKHLIDFYKGDLVVFFAAFKPIKPVTTKGKLVYALIGLLTVDKVVRVGNVPKSRWDENAHTRNRRQEPTDVIVRGKRKGSGRLAKCIPIGEYREGAYRVTKPILKEWGDLDVKNGYLQRSANPPLFKDPECFYKWFKSKTPELLPSNK